MAHPSSVASGLAALGRNGDSMLVHMSPGEVAGLQKLALAAGGSLTTNPHTGLPEASYLSSLLPVIAGGLVAFLAPPTAPAILPLVAGAATGALTGDKRQSLLMRAGLGALGGMGGGALTGALGSLGSVGAAGAEAAGAGGFGGVAGAAPAGTEAAAYEAAAAMPELGGFGGIAGAAPLGTESAAYGAMTPELAGFGGAAGAAPLGTEAAAWEAGNTLLPGIGDAIGGGMATAPAAAAPAAAAPAAVTPPATGLQGFYNQINAKAPEFAKKLLGDKAGMAMLAASMAPMMYMPNPEIPQPTPMYYVRRPGGPPLYQQGTVNPNIAARGYLPVGQSAFIGQQFNPGVLSPSYMKEGGLAGLHRMAGGGAVTPAQGAAILASNPPLPTAQPNPQQQTLQDMNRYYANQLTQAQAQAPMYSAPPSSDALNQYLANYQKMITPDVTAPEVAAPVLSAAPMDTSEGSSTGLTDIGQYNNWYSGPAYGGYDYATGTWEQGSPTGSATNWVGWNPTGFIGHAEGGPIDTYTAGGRLLRGPGDGMSDSIPAIIGGRTPQRAALADGEFVVPADVVSHLGNGSTEAGSKRLYAMMDKVRQARTGRKRQAPEVKADKYLPK